MSEPLECFEATFKPLRRDDLVPGAETLLGQQCSWQWMWVIESGPYEGEWACALIAPRPAPFAWVPESDLVAV